MIPAELRDEVLQRMQDEFGSDLQITNSSPIGGGCINNALRLETNRGAFFLKWNQKFAFPGMLEAEAKGLQILQAGMTIKIPDVIVAGESASYQFLVLEFISSIERRSDFWETFGRGLAQLHRLSSATFGLDHDNYIGSLPQRNDRATDWKTFFFEKRLYPQLKKAIDTGLLGSQDHRSVERLEQIFSDIFDHEPPSLLHGDLWSGNFMTGENGEAVILDPAVYYGHREMDLAMSQLFGGFSTQFYEAYQEEFPLSDGLKAERMDICNLYPLLVHVNLFGSSYATQVQGILTRYAS